MTSRAPKNRGCGGDAVDELDQSGSRHCRGSRRENLTRHSPRAVPPSGAASAARPPWTSASRRPSRFRPERPGFPRRGWNFSSSRLRKNGVAEAEMQDIEGKRSDHDPGQQSPNRSNITARKTTVKNRSITSVSAELVMNCGCFRARARGRPNRRRAAPGNRPCGSAKQMPEQPRAKLDIDAVGGMREEVGAQAAPRWLRTARSRPGR